MKYIVGAIQVAVLLSIAGLLMLAYEYSFGTGYGLHPGIVGFVGGALALVAMWAEELIEDDGDEWSDC